MVYCCDEKFTSHEEPNYHGFYRSLEANVKLVPIEEKKQMNKFKSEHVASFMLSIFI